MTAARFFACCSALARKIIDVDVASDVAGDHHDLHADHAGGGRIGAVRGGGDQAHLAMRLAARGVIAADREQPGIFALRAGIRLQRDRVIAGDVAQPLFQPREQRVIARRLLARRERMQVAEFRPGQRDHLRGGVELHGAGAQRNHRAVEREIAIAELAHVAQQLGLGAMGVEHRMGEERAGASQLGGQRLARAGFDLGVSKLAAERAPHRLDDRGRRGLVQRDAERAVADPQIDLSRRARGRRSRSAAAPASTVTVSKNASDRGAKPSLRNPAASTAARRCTWRAMWVSPSGP